MGGIKGGIGASKRVGASLLPISDLFAGSWGPASSSCSPVRSAGRLLQGLCQARDPRAIAIEI